MRAFYVLTFLAFAIGMIIHKNESARLLLLLRDDKLHKYLHDDNILLLPE